MSMKQKVIALSKTLRVDVFMERDERNGAKVELFAPTGYIFQSNGSHCAVSCLWYANDSWNNALEDLKFGLEVCQIIDCDSCPDEFSDQDIAEAIYYSPRVGA